MTARLPLVRSGMKTTELPLGDFIAMTLVGAMDGDTLPDPGGLGAIGVTGWSAIAKTPMHWDGHAWRFSSVPASLNHIRHGQIVAIPNDHNLLIAGTLVIEGSGVLLLQGNATVFEIN